MQGFVWGSRKRSSEWEKRTPVFLSEANGPNAPDHQKIQTDKLELMASTESLRSGSEA